MKILRAVLVASSGVCTLAIAQAHADPTEAAANTPVAATTSPDTAGWELPKLPQMQLDGNGGFYPEPARRTGLEGRVLLGFAITAEGRAKNISVIWSENGVFESDALKILKGARFSLPSGWAESGAGRRWRLGVVYHLAGSCPSEQFAIPVETIVVTGARIPGTPVRSCAPSSPH